MNTFNFEQFPVGTKIESFDKDGYLIMRACGTVEKHLGGGHVIIKDHDEVHWSTIGVLNAVEVHNMKTILFYEGSYQYKTVSTSIPTPELIENHFTNQYNYRPTKEGLWARVISNGEEIARYEFKPGIGLTEI
jgi:hypothetical protein